MDLELKILSFAEKTLDTINKVKVNDDVLSMKWQKLTSFKDLPKDGSFLIYTPKTECGTVIWEVYLDMNGGKPMMFDVGSANPFEISEVSHWCEIIHP